MNSSMLEMTIGEMNSSMLEMTIGGNEQLNVRNDHREMNSSMLEMTIGGGNEQLKSDTCFTTSRIILIESWHSLTNINH